MKWVSVRIGRDNPGLSGSLRFRQIGPRMRCIGLLQGEGSVFHPLSSDAQLFWMQGDRLVFPAESDGWLHLYDVPAGGGAPQLLTPGNFEIEYAAATPNGSALIYASNSGDIDRRHLWRLSFPSGAAERFDQR